MNGRQISINATSMYDPSCLELVDLCWCGLRGDLNCKVPELCAQGILNGSIPGKCRTLSIQVPKCASVPWSLSACGVVAQFRRVQGLSWCEPIYGIVKQAVSLLDEY
jgi:hypothetical protein